MPITRRYFTSRPHVLLNLAATCVGAFGVFLHFPSTTSCPYRVRRSQSCRGDNLSKAKSDVKHNRLASDQASLQLHSARMICLMSGTGNAPPPPRNRWCCLWLWFPRSYQEGFKDKCRGRLSSSPVLDTTELEEGSPYPSDFMTPSNHNSAQASNVHEGLGFGSGYTTLPLLEEYSGSFGLDEPIYDPKNWHYDFLSDYSGHSMNGQFTWLGSVSNVAQTSFEPDFGAAEPYQISSDDMPSILSPISQLLMEQNEQPSIESSASDTQTSNNQSPTEAVFGQEFRCDICQMTLSSRGRLQYHRDTHNKRFQCDQCPEELRFTVRRDLVRHINSKHGGPEHNCHQCGKKFVGRRDNLKRHLRKFCRG